MSDDKQRFGTGGGRLDRAIDRAVRTMMHVDPPVGLRRRVLARLDSPAPRRWWWEPGTVRLAVAAAMVIVVATLAVLVRRPPAGPPASPAPTAVTATTAQPERASGAEQPERPAAPLTGAPAAPAPKPPTTRVSPVDVFGPPTGRVQSATIATVGSDPAQSAAAPPELLPSAEAAEPGVSLLKIAPLDVKPLQIAPLVPRR